MRDDMFKVIVERPRLIHGNWLGGGREPGFRQRMARDDMPAKVGMRASHVHRARRYRPRRRRSFARRDGADRSFRTRARGA